MKLKKKNPLVIKTDQLLSREMEWEEGYEWTFGVDGNVLCHDRGHIYITIYIY